jgi:hypothetical protein
VGLRALLLKDVGYRQVQACDALYSSELLQIECRRVLWRDRLAGKLDDAAYSALMVSLEELLSEVGLVALSTEIKHRAMEAFPTHVKTLDALHLATALAVARAYPDETVAVFSYDAGMNRAAKALGLAAPWYS